MKAFFVNSYFVLFLFTSLYLKSQDTTHVEGSTKNKKRHEIGVNAYSFFNLNTTLTRINAPLDFYAFNQHSFFHGAFYKLHLDTFIIRLTYDYFSKRFYEAAYNINGIYKSSEIRVGLEKDFSNRKNLRLFFHTGLGYINAFESTEQTYFSPSQIKTLASRQIHKYFLFIGLGLKYNLHKNFVLSYEFSSLYGTYSDSSKPYPASYQPNKFSNPPPPDYLTFISIDPVSRFGLSIKF